MNKYIGFVLFVCLFSCKIGSNPDRLAAEADPTKVYRLRLDPPAGSKYYYTISSRSDYNFTVEDKKIENLSKVNAGVSYGFSAATSFMGYVVTTNFKGKQKGEYQVDTRTGLLLNATVSVNVDGTLVAMGREVPLTIESEVKMERQ
ncbi:MAG TPA: hypothetical protein VGS79_11540 [Puia sp.]|nr:hypothetical protein [Puia sp.]